MADPRDEAARVLLQGQADLRTAMHAIREARKRLGLCVACGRESPDYSFCLRCRKRMNTRARSKRKTAA